jgi:P27 family predicted phage terminase small subunit
MTGRPPKPSGMKVLEGTNRADRTNPNEPRPPLIEVGERPPAWLRNRLARAYWRELVPILSRARILALTDTTALVLLAKAYGRWRSYEDFLEANGETYETGRPITSKEGDVVAATGKILRPRPEVAMRDKAEDRLVRLLIEFGMTPSARVRVSALPELVGDPAEEFLRGSRRA